MKHYAFKRSRLAFLIHKSALFPLPAEKNLVMGLLQIATANLNLEAQESPTSIEKKFPPLFSQNGTGFASRMHRRNNLTRCHFKYFCHVCKTKTLYKNVDPKIHLQIYEK